MKVLIIDDSTLFQKMLVDIIKSTADIKSVACCTIAQGLAVLKSESIDFICVSMQLEDGNGISLSKAVRCMSQHQYTPIILFTSDKSKQLSVEAMSSGVTELFHKNELQQLMHFFQRFISRQKPLSGRVLYVEDALLQQKMVTEMFTKRGLQVDAFCSAENAWQAYVKHDYDIVVTDIVLKGSMTGKSLINNIRRLDDHKGDVPIIALTGLDDVSRRIDLFYLGVNDYVIKPLIEKELMARVRNLVISNRFYIESVKQRQRAETADKTKSEFISRMSHELRSPMNAILGFAQVLEKDAVLDVDQQDSVHEILCAGNHLLELINEVLDISKIESGHIELSLETVKLSELVQECFKLIAQQAKRQGIHISSANLDGYYVLADKTRLKQVLLNLLSNAIKYNRPQGTIELDITVVNDAKIHINVTDTGNGIAKNKLDELFQPFKRLDAENSGIEGTGIGLSISRKLVEMMGGKIHVDSQPGIGSRFWVELPMEMSSYSEMNYNSNEELTENITMKKEQYTVLYIEDNPANLKLVSRILAKQQHINLITAHEPELGLNLAGVHHPELILLDINMPHMDGYQVLSVLRSDDVLKDIPVVAVTANAMAKEIDRGKAAGFNDYMIKPLNISKFLETVEYYLDSET